MDAADAFGVAAGAMQALAYAVYLRHALGGGCRPNGASWLLWTFGTLVVLVMQADAGAPGSVLLLPAVCAACSLAVAGCGFATGRYLPPAPQDWAVLASGLAMLLGYALMHALDAAEAASARLLFVLLPGVSSAVAAWPTVRTTWRDPGNERPLAWFVWSAAFGLVAVAAMAEGLSWPYLAYPLLNQAANFIIGVIAMSRADSPAPAAG